MERLVEFEDCIDVILMGITPNILVQVFGLTDIVYAELLPMITFVLALICRATEPLREFVVGFDLSMGVSSSGRLQQGSMDYMARNVW